MATMVEIPLLELLMLSAAVAVEPKIVMEDLAVLVAAVDTMVTALRVLVAVEFLVKDIVVEPLHY